MKPVLVFSSVTQRWLKLAILLCSLLAILSACYAVYSLFYSTVLLYRCKQRVKRKNPVFQLSDTASTIKKSILEHLSVKKRYQKRLNTAYQCLDWALAIITALQDEAELEQLMITKHEIQCSIIIPDLSVLDSVKKRLLNQGFFQEVTMKSYQKTTQEKIQLSLVIMPKKGV